MTITQSSSQLASILSELCRLENETEWVEFKHNNSYAPSIGEYISALANSAALIGKQSAYLVWGVENNTHEIIGTTFKPSKQRYKQQELESWLLQKTAPKIHFQFYEFESSNQYDVVILEIQAASNIPVQFDGVEYIRIGSYKKRLRDFAEKERELWRVFDKTPFERQMATQNSSADEVFKLLDYPAYFELTNQSLPERREGILSALEADQLLQRSDSREWNITNLGAILFAKKLQAFNHLARKAVRLILYRNGSRVETIREIEVGKGYAVGFEGW
jgi:ATP-dependent DNA helicase RecG